MTATATDSPTLTPTATATATPAPPTFTPTAIPPTIPPGLNLLRNPGFEGAVITHIFNEVNVYEGWQPYYCDEPHTPEPCPATWLGDKNPPDLLMGRPEYKPVAYGQSWFCFMRPCDAGIYQTIDTLPGHYYTVAFTAQLWSEDGSNPDGQPSHGYGYWGELPDGSGGVYGPYGSSDIAGTDDLINGSLYIALDFKGATFGFADHLVYSPEYGYWEGCYRLQGDEWCQVEMALIANSYITTIFLGARFVFPFAHNDVIIRGAAVFGQPGATPTPIK